MEVLMKIKLSDDILNEFIELFEAVRDTKFEIGDKLIELVKVHRDKAGVINEVASQLNISASVLYDYYRTAEKWTPEFREIYQNLDWTIYRNSDPIKDADLLDQAIDNSWNATTFKEEKYSGLKEPSYIIGRIEAIIARGRKYFDDRGQRELDIILFRLKRLINEGRRKPS